MESSSAEFQEIVTAILVRFSGQVRESISEAQLRRVALRLSAVIAERGLPPPLRADEIGSPGSLPEQELSGLVANVLSEVQAGAGLQDAVRQLVKTCFYPEFKICRDSFRERSRDGVCRRQELSRARQRISGAHCVDCPHWVALTPAEHAEFLQREWHDDPQHFTEHQGIFLPEDFRVLRQWLHTAARSQGSTRA